LTGAAEAKLAAGERNDTVLIRSSTLGKVLMHRNSKRKEEEGKEAGGWRKKNWKCKIEERSNVQCLFSHVTLSLLWCGLVRYPQRKCLIICDVSVRPQSSRRLQTVRLLLPRQNFEWLQSTLSPLSKSTTVVLDVNLVHFHARQNCQTPRQPVT